MRAVGETRIPLVISAGAVLTNTVLNYCLIFGNFGFPRLGVEGAAIATLIARVLEAAVLLIVLTKLDLPFKTKLAQLFHVPGQLARSILIKAAAVGAQRSHVVAGNGDVVQVLCDARTGGHVRLFDCEYDRRYLLRAVRRDGRSDDGSGFAAVGCEPSWTKRAIMVISCWASASCFPCCSRF